MSKQFPVQRFARGVKVTTQHLNEPLAAIQASAEGAALEDTVEHVARNKVSWVVPYIGPAASSDTFQPSLMLPFTLPPFQQNFNRASLQDPQYQTTLTEFSLSIDQRAEPFALLGYGTSYADGPGTLSISDISRYNMTVRLLERQPSLFTGETSDYEELGKWEIDGVLAFGVQQNAVTGGQAGNGVARANPIVIADQNIPLLPWNTYQWEISCPGLWQASDPGVKDKWTFALGGAPLLPPPTGDICRLTINGNVYDYTTLAGDTLALIAAGVAALAAADPTYTVTAVGNSIVAEEITASNTINTLTCVFISMGAGGTGTVYPTHNQIGQSGTAVEPLELVSLHLCATIESPLTVRDKQGDFGLFPIDPTAKPIQNLPTSHNGQKNGTTIPLTPVVPDALMTGDDVQDAMHGFDRALRERGGSGYGTGYGPLASPMEASAPPPQELFANDAHYSMIMVPMWGGQYRESVRKENVTSAGFPYVDDLRFVKKTIDVFVLPVPEGFVLHHAFAVWNGYSPTSFTYDRLNNGTWPIDPNYEQSVGVILNSGWHGDDYKHQQVAYLNWNGATLADPLSYRHWLLDEYTPNANAPGGPVAGWRILQIPLVNNSSPWNSNSWFSSGPPFYMGKANTMTEDREVCGELPTAFGGVDWVTPVTKGRENVLEIRWQKDLTNIVDMEDSDTIVGQGGEWVILCGRQVVTI